MRGNCDLGVISVFCNAQYYLFRAGSALGGTLSVMGPHRGLAVRAYPLY